MPTDPELVRLVNSVLLPGFAGTSPPDWLRYALDDGLAGVLYFGHNVPDIDTARALSVAIQTQVAAIIAVDEEGGDVTRLEVGHGSSAPGNAALGAVDDVELTGRIGFEIGDMLRGVGIGLNLAPTVDVNSNPHNPVIGVRSFGADAELVARHGAAFIEGVQDGGVAACAKHFPGHGDTAVDSHFGLPTLDVDLDLLRSRDLTPFAAAVEAGVKTLMTGHLVVPAFGDLPATLNPALTGLVRDGLGFDGVIVTDALDMEGAKGGRGIGRTAVMAAKAGADLLCLGNPNGRSDESDYFAARDDLIDAVQSGELPRSHLEDACVRVRELTDWTHRGDYAERLLTEHRHQVRLDELEAVGADAARRAVFAIGEVRLTHAPYVVDLRTSVNPAAGVVAQHLTREISDALPGTAVVESKDAGVIAATAGGRPVVAIVRRPTPDDLALLSALQQAADVVVVFTGWPHDLERLGSRVVVTYGSGAAVARAAAELLAGRPT